MNPPAIRDLMDTLLSAWYHKAAAWAPPGRLSSDTCSHCPHSMLADFIDVAVWPHDLMHELVTSLDTGVSEISEGLFGEGLETLSEEARMALAVAAVRSTLTEHADDLVDVLTECVEPRLSAYVSGQRDVVVGSVPAWSEEFPGN